MSVRGNGTGKGRANDIQAEVEEYATSNRTKQKSIAVSKIDVVSIKGVGTKEIIKLNSPFKVSYTGTQNEVALYLFPLVLPGLWSRHE